MLMPKNPLTHEAAALDTTSPQNARKEALLEASTLKKAALAVNNG